MAAHSGGSHLPAQSPFPCLEIQPLAAETGPSLLLQQWTFQGFQSEGLEGLKGLDPWLWLTHLGQSLTPTPHQPLAANMRRPATCF